MWWLVETRNLPSLSRTIDAIASGWMINSSARRWASFSASAAVVSSGYPIAINSAIQSSFRSLEAATQDAGTPVSAPSSRWDERRIRPDWTMCPARRPSPLPSDGSAARDRARALRSRALELPGGYRRHRRRDRRGDLGPAACPALAAEDRGRGNDRNGR